MTDSLIDFIDRCFQVKCYLNASSYELHQFDDGSYADFRVQYIGNLEKLASKTRGFDTKILASGDFIIIRIFENFNP